MKNLYEPATVEELKNRMARLGPESQRQWGKMNAPQAWRIAPAGWSGLWE